MIGDMRRALVSTGVFALLVFLGFLFLSGSSPVVSLVKTLVVAALFGLYQLWMVRRQARRREDVRSP
jgi:uncharacterized membrane protein